jgi:hypothetical protein
LYFYIFGKMIDQTKLPKGSYFRSRLTTHLFLILVF